MEYNFTSNEAAELNEYVIDSLKKLEDNGKFDVEFITRSYYKV